MVQYDYPDTQPQITTFVYRGAVDGKSDTHLFKASGMSETNIFLDNKDLKNIIDIAALKLEIGA